jgi:hypothetical protein
MKAVIELKDLKPVSYYEGQIKKCIAKIEATNQFLSSAKEVNEINFANEMNKLLLKEVYHNREIIKHLRQVDKLLSPLLN